MSKFRLFLILLIFLPGCALWTPNFEQHPEYSPADLRTIGVFTTHSGHDTYDTLLHNIVKLQYMGLGYDVIDLNSQVDQPGWWTRLTRGWILDHIKRGIAANKLSVDGIALVQSKWWRDPNHRAINYPGKPQLYMRLDIHLYNADNQQLISRARSVDQTGMIVDRGFQYHRRYVPPMQDKARFVIQRNLYHTLGDFPKCNVASAPAEIQFPVVFYLDEKFRRIYGDAAETILAERVERVNHIFRREFGVEFVVRDFRTWYTGYGFSLTHFLTQVYHPIFVKLL